MYSSEGGKGQRVMSSFPVLHCGKHSNNLEGAENMNLNFLAEKASTVGVNVPLKSGGLKKAMNNATSLSLLQ